jgi:acyl carrier protein
MQTIPGNSACTPSRMDELDGIFVDLLKMTPDKIEDAMTMNDVAMWDSLRHMELITAVEQQFGLERTFEEIGTMQSIGAIRKLVAEKIKA